jgi:hypothetical protein
VTGKFRVTTGLPKIILDPPRAQSRHCVNVDATILYRLQRSSDYDGVCSHCHRSRISVTFDVDVDVIIVPRLGRRNCMWQVKSRPRWFGKETSARGPKQ